MEANKLLAGGFFDALNRCFAKKAAAPADCHVPIVNGTDLRAVFCFEVERSVGRDWMLQSDCRRFQILRDARPLPPQWTEVIQWLDGNIPLGQGEGATL